MSKSMSRAEKKEFKEKMASCEPVFKLQVRGNNRVLCKYICNVESRDNMVDDPIELTGNNIINNTINFPDQGKYQILGKAYSCNIPGGFLLKNKKIPVYYMSLIYASQLVTGSMFNFFLYFTIDEETSKTLLVPNNYVNRLLSGTFTLELVDAEGFLTYFIKKKKTSVEEEVMESFLEKFELSKTDEEKELLSSEIKNEVEKRLDEYRKFFEPQYLKVDTSRSKTLLKMENFFRNENFNEMISSCLEFTQNKRIEKMGGSSQMKIPKKILNYNDFVNDPSKIDDYVNNLQSDSDSDNDYEDDVNSNDSD